MNDIKDLKFEYSIDKLCEDRMNAIRDLSFKEKLELAIEEKLVTDEFLEELIYNSSTSYQKITEDWK